MSVRCGNHKGEKVNHPTVADVRACFARPVIFDLAGPTDRLADLVGTAPVVSYPVNRDALDRLARAGQNGQDYRARAAKLAAAYRLSGKRA